MSNCVLVGYSRKKNTKPPKTQNKKKTKKTHKTKGVSKGVLRNRDHRGADVGVVSCNLETKVLLIKDRE